MPPALDLYGGGEFRSSTHLGGFACDLSSDMIRPPGAALRGRACCEVARLVCRKKSDASVERKG